MVEWLLIGFFVGGIAAIDFTEGWQVALSQPLATGWVTGALLGEPAFGLMIGALLQLFWLARFPVGAVRLSDVSSAGVCGAVLGIVARTELGYGTAGSIMISLLVASTASALGGVLIHWARRWNDVIVGRMTANTSLARAVLAGVIRSFLRGGLLCVLVIAVWSGAASILSRIDAVRQIADTLPVVYAVAAFALGASLTAVAGRMRFVGVGVALVLALAIGGVL